MALISPAAPKPREENDQRKRGEQICAKRKTNMQPTEGKVLAGHRHSSFSISPNARDASAGASDLLPLLIMQVVCPLCSAVTPLIFRSLCCRAGKRRTGRLGVEQHDYLLRCTLTASRSPWNTLLKTRQHPQSRSAVSVFARYHGAQVPCSTVGLHCFSLCLTHHSQL